MSQSSLSSSPWSSSTVKVGPFKEDLPHIPVLSQLHPMVFINSQSWSFQRGSPSSPCLDSAAPHGHRQQSKLVLSKRVSLKSQSSQCCFPWSSSTVNVSPFKEGLHQVPVLSTASHGLHQQSKLVLSKRVSLKSKSSLCCSPWYSSTDKVGPFKEGLHQVPVLSLLLPMVFINRQSWSFQRGSPSCPCPLSTASHGLHQQSMLVLSKRVSLKSQSSQCCFPWSSSTVNVGPFKEGLPQVPVLSLLLPIVFINSQSWSFQGGSPASPSPLSTAPHGLHQQTKLVLSKRVSLMSLSSLYCFPSFSSTVKVGLFKEGLPQVPVLSLLLHMVFINRQSWSFQRGSPSSPCPRSTAYNGLHQQSKLVFSRRVSRKSQSSLYCSPWSSSTDKVGPFKEGLPRVPVLFLLLPMVFINSQSRSFQRGSPSSPCPFSTAPPWSSSTD